MAAINQRIPNFLGGVSQQPDFIKFPGQLRSCDNAVPDVTFGLMKRPPAEYVNKLTNTTSDGQWFEILNKDGEKYIVQITPANYASSPIRVWNLTTGVEVTVTEGSGNAFDYLQGAGTLGKHTIQDYTYITNPNKVVGAATTTTPDFNNSGGSPSTPQPYAFVKIDTLAYNTEYVIHIGAANSTIPDPETKNKATGIEVFRSGPGNDATGNPVVGKSSWTHLSTEANLSGQSDYDGANVTGVKGLEATVLVNGQPFFKSQAPNYDGTGTNAEDFLGYTQDYDMRFTATATLKNGGFDCVLGTTIANAVGIPDDSGTEVGYSLKVTGVKPYDTYRYVNTVAKYITPANPDKGSLSMASVLKGLKTSLEAVYAPGGSTNYTFEVVGNGIVIKKSGAAAMNVQVLGGMAGEALSVFQSTAQDISKLPNECVQGYLVEVANTEESDSDNYWLKFVADNGVKGSGVWEETVAPVISTGLDHHTMPHALVAVRNANSPYEIQSFKFCELSGLNSNPNGIGWNSRVVGDIVTNPHPSFVGEKISQIFFYRNRLGFIANEQIVLSQPSSYHNFYAVSAITNSDDNPIDITVSDTKPAYINHVLPTQKGVMMFSDAGQFMLFSEQDSFSPKTARLKKVASYECSPTVKPVDLGTTYMFTNRSGAYTRAFEMAIVDESVPPKIIDQTRVVPEFLPKTLNISSGSADLGLVTYVKNDDTYNSSSNRYCSIFHYKYFDTGEQREQSAWYSWSLAGVIKHCFYDSGFFYAILQQENNEYVLNRFEYLSEDSIANKSMGKRRYTIGDPVPSTFSPTQGYAASIVRRSVEVALDNLVTYFPSDPDNTTAGVSVAYSGGNTIITVPYTVAQISPTIVVISGDEAGVVKTPNSYTGTTITFNDIDMSSWHMAIGYQYTTTIELPQYFYSYDQGKYDIDGDLRISGYNFELGLSGPMTFMTNSVTGGDVDIYHDSGMLASFDSFQSIPSSFYKSIRVPIYRKNRKFRFFIYIAQPFSASIVSASWDGRYNTRRHVRK